MVTKEDLSKIVNDNSLTDINKIKAILALLDLRYGDSNGGGDGKSIDINPDNQELLPDDIEDDGGDENQGENNPDSSGSGSMPDEDDEFELGMIFGKLYSEITYEHGGVEPPWKYQIENLPKLPKMNVIK